MTRTRLLGGLVAATLALTACGGGDDGGGDISDLSATKILAKTKSAVADADDVSVTGEGSSEGSSINLDLGFSGKDDTTGSLSFGGAKISVLGVDGKTYIKAAPEVFKSFGENGAKIADAVGDKWIAVAPDDASFGAFAQFASRDDFFKELLNPDGDLTKTKTKEIDGIETIGLKSPTGTLYVATDDGRPISLTGQEKGPSLSFDYDDVDVPKAPGADEIVDPQSLG